MLMRETEFAPDAEAVSATQVKLRFQDGVEKSLCVEKGQTILEAAKQEGIRLVHQCLTGSCGTCVAKVVCGEVRMGTDRGTSLLPSEHAEGLRLTCTSFADTDATLALDYASTLLDEPGPQLYKATVTAKEWVASNVVKLSMELPADADFDFRSGQYVRVHVPGTDAWRSYSMASTIHDLPRVDLLLRVLDDGMMSNYLRETCKVGDAIDIEGPYGMFFWRPSKAQHIMVAGGTGLAPMLAMLDEIRGLSGKKPKVLLSFGCATEDNLFCLDELEIRAAWMPTLKNRVSVSQPGEGYTGLVGNPVSVITAQDITDPEAVAYLCGPPGMIEAARAHLESLGVKRENIYAEHFSASAE
jgi:benzoate/toluate 1,2-dioxygenase reductase subunit